MDPEALRALLARYFERMKAIVESHGGTVEKFIGDAVMAVFGIPQAHEDDALRACRAAVEMRDALPELGIRGRIGVNTGEVVTGTAERLVTGDAVNVAARFEQAAAPGEVLIGEATHALVQRGGGGGAGRAADAEGEVASRWPRFGSSRCWTRRSAVTRSRFVGRERELALIAEAWERARGAGALRAGHGGRRCRCRQVAAGGGGARWGRGAGRAWSLPALRRGDHLLAGRRGGEAAGRAAVGSGCGGGDPLAARRVGCRDERGRDRLGVPEAAGGAGAAGLSSSTTCSGARRRSSTWSRRRRYSRPVRRLLLLCMARPELVERRPAWPATLRLEPLPPEQADA